MTPVKINKSKGAENGIKMIKLRGEIDSQGALSLEKLMNELLDEKRHKIELNFSEVTFVSSAGVGMLLGFVSSFRRKSGEVFFTEVTEKVKAIFALLNLDDYFNFNKPVKDNPMTAAQQRV